MVAIAEMPPLCWIIQHFTQWIYAVYCEDAATMLDYTAFYAVGLCRLFSKSSTMLDNKALYRVVLCRILVDNGIASAMLQLLAFCVAELHWHSHTYPNY
jgi:hypothetical protein